MGYERKKPPRREALKVKEIFWLIIQLLNFPWCIFGDVLDDAESLFQFFLGGVEVVKCDQVPSTVNNGAQVDTRLLARPLHRL